MRMYINCYEILYVHRSLSCSCTLSLLLRLVRLTHLLLLLFFENTAQDFTGGVPGNGGDKFHLTYLLEGRKLAIDPCHQFIRTLVCAVFSEDNEGFGNFSRFIVLLGDDSRIVNGRMFKQQRFDLGRRDTKAFVLNHLLLAV